MSASLTDYLENRDSSLKAYIDSLISNLNETIYSLNDPSTASSARVLQQVVGATLSTYIDIPHDASTSQNSAISYGQLRAVLDELTAVYDQAIINNATSAKNEVLAQVRVAQQDLASQIAAQNVRISNFSSQISFPNGTLARSMIQYINQQDDLYAKLTDDKIKAANTSLQTWFSAQVSHANASLQTNFNDRFDKLTAEFNQEAQNLSDEIAEVSNELALITKNSTGIDLSQITTELSSLNKQVSTITSDLDQVSTKVDQTSANLDDTNTKLDTTNNGLSLLLGRVVALEKNSNTGNYNQNGTTVCPGTCTPDYVLVNQTIEERVSNVSSEQRSALNTQFNELVSKIANYLNGVNSYLNNSPISSKNIIILSNNSASGAWSLSANRIEYTLRFDISMYSLEKTPSIEVFVVGIQPSIASSGKVLDAAVTAQDSRSFTVRVTTNAPLATVETFEVTAYVMPL